MTTLAIPCLITAFLSKSRAVFYTGMAVTPKLRVEGVEG